MDQLSDIRHLKSMCTSSLRTPKQPEIEIHVHDTDAFFGNLKACPESSMCAEARFRKYG
jgi:hypothetical protein